MSLGLYGIHKLAIWDIVIPALGAAGGAAAGGEASRHLQKGGLMFQEKAILKALENPNITSAKRKEGLKFLKKIQAAKGIRGPTGLIMPFVGAGLGAHAMHNLIKPNYR